MSQLTFEITPPRHLARADDPETSVASANTHRHTRARHLPQEKGSSMSAERKSLFASDDWKTAHANESCKALDHDLVSGVIDEQMGNIGSDSALVRYGLTKIAMYAAQVARAQALGFNPDLLRLSSEEANEEQLKLARAAVAAGKPVLRIDEGGVTRLD